MACPDEESFDALLKPLENITSKVWDIALTKALENYITQINNGAIACVNFTEAAVLVQNSATFYSRRVDSVHLGCQQFAEHLMDTDKELKGTDGQPVKKKRGPKNTINDEFARIPLFFAETNINVDLDSIDKNAEKKQVILNKYPKIVRKPNTSCAVFQTKGKEMGLKEEFRLNWMISSNGVLHEDFINFKEPLFLQWCSLSEEIVEVVRNTSVELEHSFDLPDVDDMDVDHQTDLPEGGEVPGSPPSRVPTPLPPSQPPDNQPQPEVKDAFKELNFDLIPPNKEFVKRKNFKLPKEMIEEVKDWKLRKKENKEKAKDPNYTFTAFFDFLKHRILMNCTSARQNNISSSAKLRRKKIRERQKYYDKATATAAAEDCNDDFQGFDDGNDSDDDIANIDMINPTDEIHPVEVGGFSEERDNIMMAAKDLKSRNAAVELTEVARRVEAWHESLHDVLENAESRAQFDVHQYGTKILAQFDKPPECHPILEFKHIAQGQPKHEISRHLLSCLMLANTYNVEIIKDPGFLVKDCLSLKLLSTVRHHEEMDENLRSNTHS